MRDWLSVASQREVVRRAAGYAVVVGSILIVINHGDALLNGNVAPAVFVKMGLTAVVPYLVSTFSSVGAIRALRPPGTP